MIGYGNLDFFGVYDNPDRVGIHGIFYAPATINGLVARETIYRPAGAGGGWRISWISLWTDCPGYEAEACLARALIHDPAILYWMNPLRVWIPGPALSSGR